MKNSNDIRYGDFMTALLLSVIAFCVIRSCTSCTYGTLPEIITEELTDSCDLQDIETPHFRAIWSIGRIDTVPEYAFVQWGEYSSDWIVDYAEVKPLSEAIREVVSSHITFDSMVMLDHSGVINNMAVIDFWIAFRNDGGNWNQPNTLHIRLPGYVSSWGIPISQDENMMIGTLANYGAQDVAAIIHALPSWQRFRMKHTNLSQADKTIIYDALLSNCKCCARLDTQSLSIPQDYIDQFVYQNITMQ